MLEVYTHCIYTYESNDIFPESGRSFKVTAAILKKTTDAKPPKTKSEPQSTSEGGTTFDIQIPP